MNSYFLMDPFTGLANRMDSIFGRVGRAYPDLAINESDEGYEIKAFLPGVPKEVISVELERGVLTIKGKVEHAADKDAVIHLGERFSGEFERKLRLPAAVVGEDISAVQRDGVLTLKVRKAEEAKPRQITIS